jgi:hypothetical protein
VLRNLDGVGGFEMVEGEMKLRPCAHIKMYKPNIEVYFLSFLEVLLLFL